MRRRLLRRLSAFTCFAAMVAMAAGANGQVQLPQTVYVYPMGNFAQNAMISSLAGVVNRTTNGELMLTPDNGAQPNPRFWLDRLREQYPTVNYQVQSNTLVLINQYKSRLSGYVLYDRSVNPHSLNIATSIAGVRDAIIVDPSVQINAIAAGLPMLADARNMTYAQAYDQYAAQYNKDILLHQDLFFDHHLRDYAIQNRIYTYWTDPTALNPYASNQNHQGRILGWANSEFELFNQSSQNNQQAVASNYGWSYSTTSKWKVPVQGQKHHTPGNVTTKTGKHYVAFVMSDGDNVQWLTNGFGTDPKWFGSPHRGNFNMTWDYSPSLKDVNPVAHNWLYAQASDGTYKDSFVAAGGAGTMFPSVYPDIAGLANDIGASMESADLKVTSILDPTYNTSKLYPIVDDPRVMGMMFKSYANYYRSGSGSLEFRNGKPIMRVRYSLWDGADTALSIANALNANTHRDAVDDSLSYTIVNVHPWSVLGPDGTGSGDPMSNLNQLVQWLDPTKVEVVTLEELFVQLRNHFGTPLPGAVINATWTRNASSNWGTRTNWTGAMPNFVDANVTFGNAITAARTVTVNLPVTAGSIQFNSAFSYTIGGANSVTLDVTSGQAGINVANGSHSLTAPLALADDTIVTVTPAASTLTAWSLGDTSRTITKTGAGTFTANRIRAGGLTVTNGTVRIINNGGATGLSAVGSLAIAPGAALDLANNDLVVNAGSFAEIQALVAQGFGGTTGVISSTSNGTQILALFDNALVGTDTWLGVPIIANAIVGKYTFFGDVGYDGQVTGDDYAVVDANLNTTPAVGLAWLSGDANLDGSVTGDDYVVIDANLGLGQGGPLTPSQVPVPEPGTLVVLLFLVMGGRGSRGAANTN